MEIKLRRPGLDDPGYFKHAEETSLFFSVMRNPASLSVQDINKAKSWLISLVVVPEGENEKKYINKAKSAIEGLSFNELVELVANPIEPDPK